VSEQTHAAGAASDSVVDRRSRVCVIGAGSSGLTAARNLMREGFEVDVLERCEDLGGNWNIEMPVSRVYRSTHTISSKPGTEFPDFPMPDEFPDYPHHTEILRYLKDYARETGVLERIEFGAEVVGMHRADEGNETGDRYWDIELDSGAVRRYGAVVIANGHLWDPLVPEYPGEFTGRTMHSAEYKQPDRMADQRVMVVGGGNSGCDIACEATHLAEEVFHSTRRGYYYIPKYLWGQPSDQVGDLMHRLRVPMRVQRMIAKISLRLALGPHEKLGLPEPDHDLFETHPIVNSLLPYYVQHGVVTPKPDIERLDGTTVHFVDGSSEEIDLIVWATGYNAVFPFLDDRHLNLSDGKPDLYKHVFHPEYDNLFLAGLIHPDSGQFGIVHRQCRAVALYWKEHLAGSSRADRIKEEKRDTREDFSAGIRFKKTQRHDFQVQHAVYIRSLEKLIGKLGG